MCKIQYWKKYINMFNDRSTVPNFNYRKEIKEKYTIIKTTKHSYFH